MSQQPVLKGISMPPGGLHEDTAIQFAIMAKPKERLGA